MVTVDPAQLRLDAERLFREPGLPSTFEFFDRLSAVDQRLFLVEVWEALSRLAITGPSEQTAFVDLIEAWEATADLDSAPELADEIRRPKTYRPVAP